MGFMGWFVLRYFMDSFGIVFMFLFWERLFCFRSFMLYEYKLIEKNWDNDFVFFVYVFV